VGAVRKCRDDEDVTAALELPSTAAVVAMLDDVCVRRAGATLLRDVSWTIRADE
jgi:ABC-type molybdenum transport system ATPase subunit/photorepair protein PhrA